MSEWSPKPNAETRLTILHPTRRTGSRRTRSRSGCRLAGWVGWPSLLDVPPRHVRWVASGGGATAGSWGGVRSGSRRRVDRKRPVPGRRHRAHSGGWALRCLQRGAQWGRRHCRARRPYGVSPRHKIWAGTEVSMSKNSWFWHYKHLLVQERQTETHSRVEVSNLGKVTDQYWYLFNRWLYLYIKLLNISNMQKTKKTKNACALICSLLI